MPVFSTQDWLEKDLELYSKEQERISDQMSVLYDSIELSKPLPDDFSTTFEEISKTLANLYARFQLFNKANKALLEEGDYPILVSITLGEFDRLYSLRKILEHRL